MARKTGTDIPYQLLRWDNKFPIISDELGLETRSVIECS